MEELAARGWMRSFGRAESAKTRSQLSVRPPPNLETTTSTFPCAPRLHPSDTPRIDPAMSGQQPGPGGGVRNGPPPNTGMPPQQQMQAQTVGGPSGGVQPNQSQQNLNQIVCGNDKAVHEPVSFLLPASHLCSSSLPLLSSIQPSNTLTLTTYLTHHPR